MPAIKFLGCEEWERSSGVETRTDSLNRSNSEPCLRRGFFIGPICLLVPFFDSLLHQKTGPRGAGLVAT